MESRSEIIKSKPIADGLNSFRSSYNSSSEGLKNSLLGLIAALQGLPACRSLPSKRGNRDLFGDLLALNTAIYSDNFDIERLKPLLNSVLNNEVDDIIWEKVYDAVNESTPPPRALSSIQQTPWLHKTSSFANSSEHRKYIDGVLKEELGTMHIDVPGFFEVFFEEVAGLEAAANTVFQQCKEGDNPLYQDGYGWQGWPEDAKEKYVLSWFAQVIGRLSDLAEEYQPTPRTRRRPLAQPHKTLQGSTADRKLDIGFVDDPNADAESKHHWSRILVPGELKCNTSADIASKAWLDLGRYAREILTAQDNRRFVLGFTLCGSHMRLWEFDRLGAIASTRFDINEDGLQFVYVVLGFLWLNEEQLGFDPTIIIDQGVRYIEIERHNRKERLIIDKLIKRAPCIAGRATTCWKAHREGDDSQILVIKDSWQYPEREEEGELLREASDKNVVNVARYYYHETVRVGGYDDDTYNNVRKGLDISKAANYKPEGSMLPLRATRRTSRQGRSSGIIGQKRSSETPLPPSKRTCSSSPSKTDRRTTIPNRVHRRVVISDYGKPIYKASSRVALLEGLIGCIEGYESLYTRTGMLQRDISVNNLIINEDERNPSWRSFLIDLDLSIKEQRESVSGARGKTGTRAFMAIGVLFDEGHSFMDDLESFFWVVFWICIHYNGPDEDIGPTEFECWNYEGDRKLAELKKGLISDERDFLKTVDLKFTSYYRPLISCINRLRRVVFPNGGRWKEEDQSLSSQMKEILQGACDDPVVLGLES